MFYWVLNFKCHAVYFVRLAFSLYSKTINNLYFPHLFVVDIYFWRFGCFCSSSEFLNKYFKFEFDDRKFWALEESCVAQKHQFKHSSNFIIGNSPRLFWFIFYCNFKIPCLWLLKMIYLMKLTLSIKKK